VADEKSSCAKKERPAIEDLLPSAACVLLKIGAAIESEPTQTPKTAMSTTIFSDSALTSELSESKMLLLEPVLAIAAAAFWLVALPFAAVSLMAVKVWDALVALVKGHGLRPNPLILRQTPAKNARAARASNHAAEA
jgi:hypothetical protein